MQGTWSALSSAVAGKSASFGVPFVSFHVLSCPQDSFAEKKNLFTFARHWSLTHNATNLRHSRKSLKHQMTLVMGVFDLHLTSERVTMSSQDSSYRVRLLDRAVVRTCLAYE